MPHNMVQLMHELSPEFAARDARTHFIAENYVALKQRSVLTWAGSPSASTSTAETCPPQGSSELA